MQDLITSEYNARMIILDTFFVEMNIDIQLLRNKLILLYNYDTNKYFLWRYNIKHYNMLIDSILEGDKDIRYDTMIEYQSTCDKYTRKANNIFMKLKYISSCLKRLDSYNSSLHSMTQMYKVL